MSNTRHPLALIVLDGWGYRAETEHNAISAATKPYWEELWQNCPHTLLSASGTDVGLPEGQIGNSEVGHLHMGAGRVVYQDLTLIDKAIADGSFFKNAAFVHAIREAKSNDKALHVLGLLSPGGVHSHENHLYALIELAAEHDLKKLFFHVFLDGRDTPPQSAAASIAALEDRLHTHGHGRIASVIGRYYAMDRDKRWERTKVAYDLLTEGKAAYHADTASDALQLAYQRGETDEFVQATSIQAPATIADGDSVIFMNYRSDRARQLSYALTEPLFTHFERDVVPKLGEFVSLTSYAANLSATVAYPSPLLTHLFGEYVAEKGLRQLRIAETEKYAHVTFFFNGGVEANFPGEDRILIPSPKIATYDKAPAMSAVELTDRLVEAIHRKAYDVIICNYANPDMLGHTGDFAATVTAIETMDACLSRVISALKTVNGEAIITADHGNAECMYDPKTKQPHTAHTTEPVPFIYVGRPATITHEHGTLIDIAPTMLYLLGLKQPVEMTGASLLSLR